MLAWVSGDWCGERSIPMRIAVPVDQPSRVCVEWEAGASNAGRIALAVVDPNIYPECPTSGDSAYQERAVTNGALNITQVRLGTPQLNYFQAGEEATLYFDQFESFRTLAP